MPKKNKFSHKWIFDPELPKCKETGIQCLTYLEVKDMLCGLRRMINTLEQSNNSRVRTEAVRNHFNKTNDVKTMHG